MARLSSMRWRDWYGRGRYVPELPPIAHGRKKLGQGSQVIRRSSQRAAERPCLFHSLRKGSIPSGIGVLKWSSTQRTNQLPVRFCDQCARAFQQKGVRRHKSTNIRWFVDSINGRRGTATAAMLGESHHPSRCFFHSGTSPATSIDIRLIAYGDESLCTNWFSVGVCIPCREVFVAKRALKMKQTYIWWQMRPVETPTSKKQRAPAEGKPSVAGGNPTPGYKRFGKRIPEPGYRRRGIRRDRPSW